MVGLQEFFDARVADLTLAQGLLSKAIQDKAVPSLNDVPSSAIYTSLAAIVGVQILVMMLTSKGRRVVLDTVETILAVALIVVLLAVVIGCPIGIVYLSLKALSFLLSVAMGIPAVASLVGTVSSVLGK